jgi:hypothetical protein
MANELKWVSTAAVSLATSGASATSGQIVSVGTLTTANHVNFPFADFMLNATWAASHASGSSVNLYARHLNIDGTNDQDSPGASFRHELVGVFPAPGSGASGSHIVFCRDVPTSPIGDVEYFIENSTNATINAGWKVTVYPKSYVPGA